MKLKTYLGLFAFVLLLGCNKNDDVAPVVKTFSDLVVTTKQPVLASNSLSFSTGGNLNFELENSFGYDYGVCYNNFGNPTFSDQIAFSQINGTSFDINVSNLTFGATYYVKSFVRSNNTGEIKYGNEVTVQIPFSLTTSIVKNISATGFSVEVNVGSSLSSNDQRGICYSTSQNPTVDNNKVSDVTAGAGNYIINAFASNTYPSQFVNPNTTYYLRSYIRINNNYYYGNQVTFRTAGYIGGSGGYVFYDKGEVTNGWRYLEAAPSSLSTSSYSYFQWSNTTCGSSFLPGIGNVIGDGSNNSILIKNFCNYTNIGATMCKNTSLNGQTDWFLPSIDELKELYKLKHTGFVSFGTDLLSSSQSSNTLCFALTKGNGTSYTSNKYNSLLAWQVRQF